MQSDIDNNGKQPSKRNPFAIMNAVRDNCQQSDAKKNLIFTLATYCDRDGMCWPGNQELVKATRKSKRTIQRLLKQLEADHELKIISPGVGRGAKRIISLIRYAPKGDKVMTPLHPAKGDKAVSPKGDEAMTPLNMTGSLGKTGQNIHTQQPPNIHDGASSLFGSLEEAERHKCWHPFAKYCQAKGGKPTLKGFETWLQSSRPGEHDKLAERREAERREAQGNAEKQKRLAALDGIPNKELLARREALIERHKVERHIVKPEAIENEMRDIRDTLRARNVEFVEYRPCSATIVSKRADHG